MRLIQATAGTMFAGGTDTVRNSSLTFFFVSDLFSLSLQTWASISSFILAMLVNPEAQNAAQRELDAFLAPGELPSFKDEASLPYVSAIVKEVYRWKPVTPLGMHALSMQRDTFVDWEFSYSTS